jgi:hypothetical protein
MVGLTSSKEKEKSSAQKEKESGTRADLIEN